ncbi:hypothetical protein KDX26_19310 [Burkholderia cenocepacia]|uniref:hypothetical protein n=1 Tax=Burkholderia cenocepacia TaxID=95486 RepID=UPI001B9DEB41|nr:hypothetical protein [Burkholderia cenocepacia]MBR8384548.1 hypothetical protein [Burkholderia cenocepacia]
MTMRAIRSTLALVALLACGLAHADTLTIDQAMNARRALDAVQAAGAHVDTKPEVRAWLLDDVANARRALETAQRSDVKQRLIDVAIRARVAAMLLNTPALTPAAAAVDGLAQRL